VFCRWSGPRRYGSEEGSIELKQTKKQKNNYWETEQKRKQGWPAMKTHKNKRKRGLPSTTLKKKIFNQQKQNIQETSKNPVQFFRFSASLEKEETHSNDIKMKYKPEKEANYTIIY